jgi:hypothetical protein
MVVRDTTKKPCPQGYSARKKRVADRSPAVNPKAKHGHRGHGNIAGPGTMPLVPTAFLPGTGEKIAVMTQRARNGEILFHPADAQHDKRNFLDVTKVSALTGEPLAATRLAASERHIIDIDNMEASPS